MGKRDYSVVGSMHSILLVMKLLHDDVVILVLVLVYWLLEDNGDSEITYFSVSDINKIMGIRSILQRLLDVVNVKLKMILGYTHFQVVFVTVNFLVVIVQRQEDS